MKRFTFCHFGAIFLTLIIVSCGGGGGSSNPGVSGLDPPTTLKVPATDSDGNYSVSWTPVAGSGVTYTLEESTTPDFSGTVRSVYTGEALSISITSQDQNTTYYYRVKALKGGTADSGWRQAGTGCLVKAQTAAPVYSIVTFSGSGASAHIDGSATTAAFISPYDIATTSNGGFYVSEQNAIRLVDAAGTVATIAGSTTRGFVDAKGTAARFSNPAGIAVTANGDIYVVDMHNHAIRKIDSGGNVTTVAGNGSAGSADGSGSAAKFNTPNDIVLLKDGNFLITDTMNHRIRKMTPAGVVTTIAGNSAGYQDGSGTAARFDQPTQLALDPADGSVYVADGTDIIRRVTAGGTVTTVIATGLLPDIDTGVDETEHPLYSALGVDISGRLLFSEYYSGILYRWTGSDAVPLLGPEGQTIGPGGIRPVLLQPTSLAVSSTSIVVVENSVGKLIKIAPATTSKLAPQKAPLAATVSAAAIPWPVSGFSSIAAGYGEVRPGGNEPRHHFHEGIDFVGLNSSDLIAVDDLQYAQTGSMSVTFQSRTDASVQWRYTHTHPTNPCPTGRKCLPGVNKNNAGASKVEETVFDRGNPLPINIYELGHTHLTKLFNDKIVPAKKLNFAANVGWSDTVPPTFNKMANGADIGILRAKAHKNTPSTSASDYFYPYNATTNTYNLTMGDKFEIIVNGYDQVDSNNNAGEHKIGVTMVAVSIKRANGIEKYGNAALDFSLKAEIGQVKDVFANGSNMSTYLYHVNHVTGADTDTVSTAGWVGEYEVWVEMTGTREDTTRKMVRINVADADLLIAYQYDEVTAAGIDISHPGTKVFKMSNSQTIPVGLGIPIEFSASGKLVRTNLLNIIDPPVMEILVNEKYDDSAPWNLLTCQSCRMHSLGNNYYYYEDSIGLNSNGRLFYPGSYTFATTTTNGSQVNQTNNGIVSMLAPNIGFDDISFDINGSGKIDTSDSFIPSWLAVGQDSPTIAFDSSHLGTTWLAVVSDSGTNLTWLTPTFSQDLSISDNGSRVAFKMGQTNDFHLAAMSTFGGTPVDLEQKSGLTLISNGGGLSPSGYTVSAVYASATEVGIVLLNAITGAIEKKINLSASNLYPDTYPPQFSKDGNYVVFPAFAQTGGTMAKGADLYMIKTDGTGLRNLTNTDTLHESRPLVR
ncbi:teneurin-2 [Geobacter sp. OR-1]|uniref:hypothetical protein n=1 Tax=Geobacter sp. OR-1 TaxID=1266765 RepID=UPI000541C339|nr:hypothetical protein [Geobacter sp. OR-1]GAM08494.1 teneurin-2 [Geobacter sp. OR-1]